MRLSPWIVALLGSVALFGCRRSELPDAQPDAAVVPGPIHEQAQPAPIAVPTPTPEWIPVGAPQPAMAEVRSCAGGKCGITKQPSGQIAQLYRWGPAGPYAHCISSTAGVLGWWIYDGEQPRWVGNP